MKNRIFGAFALSVLLSACATAPTVPTKRPMTEEAKQQISDIDVVLLENHRGMGASWFMTQSNGAGAGIGGVIGAAIADAIINAAPSSRANKTANEVAEKVLAEDLNSSFMDALKSRTSLQNDGMTINTVSMVNGLDKSFSNDGKLRVSVRYLLAEDASAFRATATATYEDSDIPYVTPYIFEDKTPKSQIGGPVYTNSFVFNSSQFQQPVLTEALKVELVKAVEDSFRDDEGNLPSEGSEFKKMQKAVENAKDNNLKKSEASVFLTQNWLEDNALSMKDEINNAHIFFAKYILKDLSNTEVPSLDGMDEIVESLESGRTVKIVGQGTAAGSYVSEPGNVSSFTTYGNAVNYSKIGNNKLRNAK